MKTPAPIHLDLTREQLFRKYLVPCGQVAQVLVDYVTPVLSSQKRANLTSKLFYPLSLASCYAMSPGADLSRLANALSNVHVELRQQVDKIAATKKWVISGTFHALEKLAPELACCIHEAIEFESPKVADWLAQMLAEHTPLTRNGKINIWRTLVRHSPWGNLAPQFPPALHSVVNSLRARHNRRNSVGELAAEAIWATAFLPTDSSGIPEDRPAAASEPLVPVRKKSKSATATPTTGSLGQAIPALDSIASPTAASKGAKPVLGIPPQVKVCSTANGLLQVTATVSPALSLSLTHQEYLRNVESFLSFAQREQFATATCTRVCEVAGLALAVEQATQWLELQRAKEPEILLAIETIMAARQIDAVRKKLKKALKAEDLRTLSMYLMTGLQPEGPEPLDKKLFKLLTAD